MNLSGIEMTSPLALSNVDCIPSFEMRNNLRKTVSSFYALFNEIKHIPMDESVRISIDNFMGYLKKSFESPTVLSGRANWIIRYGDVIINRLISVKYRNTKFSADFDNPQHEQLMDKIATMIDTIKQYHQRNVDVFRHSEGPLVELLDKIIIEAFDVRSHNTSEYYKAIVSNVEEITEVVECNEFRTTSVNEMMIMNLLIRLSYRIRYYADHAARNLLH